MLVVSKESQAGNIPTSRLVAYYPFIGNAIDEVEEEIMGL